MVTEAIGTCRGLAGGEAQRTTGQQDQGTTGLQDELGEIFRWVYAVLSGFRRCGDPFTIFVSLTWPYLALLGLT